MPVHFGRDGRPFFLGGIFGDIDTAPKTAPPRALVSRPRISTSPLKTKRVTFRETRLCEPAPRTGPMNTFDAHMRINNGLTHVSLEEDRVEVHFTDEAGGSVLASSDPDNTEALFFFHQTDVPQIAPLFRRTSKKSI